MADLWSASLDGTSEQEEVDDSDGHHRHGSGSRARVPLMLRCLSVGDDIFNRHAELVLYLLESSGDGRFGGFGDA